jgi:membrane-associated phospholipid phosphatase
MPIEEPLAVTSDSASERRRHRIRVLCIVVYGLAFVVSVALSGFPASRDRVVIWVIAGLVLVAAGRPNGLSRLVVDFLPVILFLYAYDLLRGSADGLTAHVYTLPQLRVDEWLFGGTAPTLTLQHALWTAGHPHVWDYIAIAVYLTYFLLPITIAAVLWYKARGLFGRFVALWIGLSFAGLLTYALYPASPPWLASRQGFLPHVVRITPKLTHALGVNLSRVMDSQRYVNKVAAVPSLHAATALLIALFFWPRTVRWRWLLALYPIAMAVSLVYLGEHYASDVLLGWLYAIVVFLVGNRLYDRWAAGRAARTRIA